MLDVVGYIASALTIASFAVSGERRIRIVNILASSLFAVYSAAIGAVSMVVLNVAIVLVHIGRISGRLTIELSNFHAQAAYIASCTAMLALLFFSGSVPAVELLGFASAFILLYGFLQSGELLMRRICLASCLLFVAYSALIGAVPLLISNGALACVHVVKLVLLRCRELETKQIL